MENSSNYLSRVSKIQQDRDQWAAFCSTGSQVVRAGPGSGKTYLLTTKVAQVLLEGQVRFPQMVACVTYSRQLASDLAANLTHLGVNDPEKLYVGTIHSFCIREIVTSARCILAENELPYPFRIASTAQKDEALLGAIALQVRDHRISADLRNVQANLDKYRRLHFDYSCEGFDDRPFAEADGYSRNRLSKIDWARLALDYTQQLMASPRPSVDFIYVEMLALKLISKHHSLALTLGAKFPQLFVDEYQDLSPLFHRTVMRLCEDQGVVVFAIGDANQCIYEVLSGSKPEFLDEIDAVVNRTCGNSAVVLNTSYRLTQNIIELGDAVLGKRTGYRSNDNERIGECSIIRTPKHKIVDTVRAILITLLKENSNTQSIHEPIAVLVPTRAVLGTLYKEFQALSCGAVAIDKDPDFDSYLELTNWIRDLATWTTGGRIYFHQLVQMWRQLIALSLGPLDPKGQFAREQHLFETIWSLQDPSLSIHDWLWKLAKQLDFGSLMDTYETVRPDDVDELRAMYEVFKIDPTPTRTVIELAQSSPKVFFTTLHGSKGLEFATVLVVGLDIVHERAATRKEDERLAYVAVTRAKSKLWLLLERENSSIAKWLNQHPIEGLNYWQLEGGALGYMTDSGTYLRNK